MIKAIIFDFDGVIAESNDIKTDAFARLFEEEGNDVVSKVVDHHLKNMGVSRYDKFRYIYKYILEKPLSDDRFNTLCRRFSELVMDGVVAAPFVKGAKEFLERHRSDYRFFVVSATPKEEINIIVNRKKMKSFFSGVYGSPDKKTDVAKEILEKENVSPADALYVGDAMSDYKAARDNRVNFVARINNNEYIFEGVDCPKISDLTRLEKLIETIESEVKHAE